ncbi:MAG: preprotein translocase subunit SecA [Candidatus Colwellbacteria bacterium]|nr:preprotein translocase subunit SecA [Candidatus Colwellbacteria bacterium]
MNIVGLLRRFLGFTHAVPPEIQIINSFEEELTKLSDGGLKEESIALKNKVKDGVSLEEILPRAYALIRESARRTLGQRHFDVQLWGGIMLHRGGVAEMMTGEGKTLASTAPIYLNALSEDGVHVITVNDYLAKRDAVWMGQIYNFLGLKVACLVHEGAFVYDPTWNIPDVGEVLIDKERDATGSFLVQEEFLRPISRREAYLADITYGTNHEFGFDYLRDNLAQDTVLQVQRGLNFAVIDEVDSVLIDEARTPLIISAADRESSDYYRVFAKAVSRLNESEDYLLDEKLKSVEITEAGINKVEAMTGVGDLYSLENIRLVHYLESSLKAKALFLLDRDYVIREGEIVIVDQFTGRLMLGRRYSAGIHQAIEAKEGLRVNDESRTFAQITIQNYFRLYKKIAGMTGTAQTSAEEFHKVYGLEVASIPPNRLLVRNDRQDFIYKNILAKYKAIIEDVKTRHKAGQPVLIGSVSIEKNEALSRLLDEAGIPHETLNAKNHEREGSIIAQAGRMGAVTVATNMAGRGVDIVLGGNPPDVAMSDEVKKLGGLHVIGTERHEARRIDNQLRGRAGRQGDPGSSQFFLSLEDDLMRVFGGERIKGLMERLNVPDDMPIENKVVSRAVSQAQSKIEGFNFDARKHLLEYDDVLNKQRLNFYARRQKVLTAMNDDDVKLALNEAVASHLERLRKSNISHEEIPNVLREAGVEAKDLDEAQAVVSVKIAGYKNTGSIRSQILSVLDFLWMNNLEDIDALAESVRIRAYGQKDPLVEYRRESRILFDAMIAHFESWVFGNLSKFEDSPAGPTSTAVRNINTVVLKDVGRNDACPCGSGKKYKRCGLINTEEHQSLMKQK